MNLIINLSFFCFFIILLSCDNSNKAKLSIYNLQNDDGYHNIFIKRGNVVLREYRIKQNSINYDKNYNYSIDTISGKLFLNLFNESIRKIDVESGKEEAAFFMNTNQIRNDNTFSIKLFKNIVICRSNRNLFLFSNELGDIRNYMDSILKNDPEVKTSIYGFWDYKIHNDSIVISLQLKEHGSKNIISKSFAYSLPSYP